MKQNEKIQTRKDEVRFKTSDIRRIIGKYLATNVLRTWNEDFVDVDTAKVVITAWINSKIKERIEKENEECKVVDISILAASPFACNAIVEKAFCLAYKEQEESY